MNLVTVPGYFLHALAEIGVSEIKGADNNKIILAYWNEAQMSLKVSDDETSWCAAFVGAMLFRDGVEGTKLPNAKSYATWGDEWTGTGIGAVVVLNRAGNAPKWQGHVGFLAGVTSANVHVVGGNQGDRVSIAAFPRARVMTIRQPKGVKLPSGSFVLSAPSLPASVAPSVT